MWIMKFGHQCVEVLQVLRIIYCTPMVTRHANVCRHRPTTMKDRLTAIVDSAQPSLFATRNTWIRCRFTTHVLVFSAPSEPWIGLFYLFDTNTGSYNHASNRIDGHIKMQSPWRDEVIRFSLMLKYLERRNASVHMYQVQLILIHIDCFSVELI